MVDSSKLAFKLNLISIALLLSACSTTQPNTAATGLSAAELEQRNNTLLEREKAVAKREVEAQEVISQAQASSAKANKTDTMVEELLPPNARSGECYARVWVEPTYKNYTETILVKEASERFEINPASYQTVEETVLVQPAGFKMVAVPAKYDFITEQKLVNKATNQWLVDLKKGSAPASKEVLDAAAAHGIDLDSATAGMCFHEHYLPAKYEKVNESVLISEASEVVKIVPAKYRWVEKQVLVKEESSRIEQVPAKYKTVTEKVVDVPAHTIWKKGTGPIQKINEATGEIMCLVDIPTTYKTLSKRVLVTPASTRTVAIPAVYKTVKVQELISESKEVRTSVPAKYKDVTVTNQVASVGFIWHEVHNHEHPASTRTGKKICLTESPAKYETVKRRVVSQEAGSKRIEIPAKYKTVQLTKLTSQATEKRIEIPAEYSTVNLKKIDQDGFMEWRSILCDTNMTRATIIDIQNALKSKGYNPGPIDGDVGPLTVKAVNAFQTDNNLPTDKYINMETVRALGVKI